MIRRPGRSPDRAVANHERATMALVRLPFRLAPARDSETYCVPLMRLVKMSRRGGLESRGETYLRVPALVDGRKVRIAGSSERP